MTMTTRPLGTDELQVSVVGLGCNNFGRKGSLTEDPAGTDAVLGAALDAGVTFLDTANMYGGPESVSEQLMGRVFKATGRRDEAVLATKFGMPSVTGDDQWGPHGARRYITNAIDGSLRRLQTDWIDLYQLHRPDPTTPIEETIEVLTELRQAGKIRFFGHSNLDAAQVREADDVSAAKQLDRFVSAQNEYSLLNREVEADLVGALTERGLGLLPFFPLANGLLTGKYTKDVVPAGSRLELRPERHDVVDDATWAKLARYREICDGLGLPEASVSIAWLLAQRPVASVIAGATKPEQVIANAAAADVVLADDVVAEISELFA